ncbi:unnamed protein product [Phytomonas sp. EM1]|nr:unnamed protein product [Phytomonas sp. EM1]|eukprot:CCW60430.1 unnamed protein product [Phytomonas sp. isolate EM1]
MVVVHSVGNGVELCSCPIQYQRGEEITSRRLPLPPSENGTTHDQSSEDLKMNVAAVQNISTGASVALNTKLNTHTFGREGMIANDETNARTYATSCKVIQSRIEKASFSMTHLKAPDHLYRHTSAFCPVDVTSARKPTKPPALYLMELNQKGASENTDENPPTGVTQVRTRRVFVQKEIASVVATAEQSNSFNRSMADSMALSTTLCRSDNCISNEGVNAAVQTPCSPSLVNKDMKISEAATGRDATTVITAEDENFKADRGENINHGVANGELKVSNPSVIKHDHVDLIDIKATRSSRGISAYLLAQRNQSGSVTPSSAIPSGRRKQSMLAPIPHYSMRHRAALSNFLSNATKRRSTVMPPATEDTTIGDPKVQESAVHQETPDTGKDAKRPSKLSAFKLNSIPHMSNLEKPDSQRVQYPITAHQMAMSKRGLQPRKTMVVFLSKYPVVRTVGKEMDFTVQETENEFNEFRFNLCWSDTVLSLSRLVRLGNWQRSNHFPSMFLLCQKSHLSTTLGRMKRKLPNYFHFVPNTWSLATERFSFQQYFNDLKQRGVSRYFIVKPSVGSQGRGIIVTNDPLSELENTTNCVVQEYIHRPLLFEGRKFDLRVYVLLIGIREPSIFMFNDGLVRICTEAYEPPNAENSKNSFKHLTNYAINKRSASYVFNTDVDRGDIGNKRNFKFMNSWLESEGHSVANFWDRVGCLVVKAIMSAQPKICQVYDACFPGYNEGYTCFEVLGFDVLVDYKLKPWLLEVNHTPSFSTDTPLDLDIKGRLLREVLSIVDCSSTDREQDRRREREEFTQRNMPPWTKNNAHHSQWNYALNLLRQKDDDANNKNRNAGTSSPTVRTIVQHVDNDDRSTSTLHPAGNQPESDSELFAELVRLHRKREDSRLVNFKRIYPSSNPEIQEIYDTIRKVAAATLNNPIGTVKTSSSPRSHGVSQSPKAVHSTSLNIQHSYDLQRPLQNSKEGEKGPHHTLPDCDSAPQVTANRTSTTFLDTPPHLQKVMLNTKLSEQPTKSNILTETPKTSQQSPSQLSEKPPASEAEPIKADNECISKIDPLGLSNGDIPTLRPTTSMIANGDTPQGSHPASAKTDGTAEIDEVEPTPTSHPNDALRPVSLEPQPVSNETASVLNNDASPALEASDLLSSRVGSPCPLVDEVHVSEPAALQSSTRQSLSVKQPSNEKSPRHVTEREPNAEELCSFQALQRQVNVGDQKDPTECESFDLSD